LISQVSAFSQTIHTPEELAPVLARAFAIFDSARPRPVHIELPINVMLASADHLPVPSKPARLQRPVADESQLKIAADLLNRAQRPVILAGGGAKGAATVLQALAETIDAPVIMTTNGRGILPKDHPLGVSVSASMRSTRSLIEAADVVLAIGTELGPTDYDMYEDGFFAIPGTLIRMDIDPQQSMRPKAPDLGILGDAKRNVDALLPLVKQASHAAKERIGAAMKTAQAEIGSVLCGDLVILHQIRDLLPDVIFVGDSTQLVYAGNLGFAADRPGSYFNSATGYGTLGYGLPAAIGAKIAAGQRPVVVLAGDGGVQFSLSELGSAKEAGVPLILLLHNNFGFGEIKSYMVSKNIPPLGVDLYTPDFLAIGKAYGWETHAATSLYDLYAAVQKAALSTEPTMILFGDDIRKEAEGQT
jgi:acetolactate synthase-1/2/3 large subunit